MIFMIQYIYTIQYNTIYCIYHYAHVFKVHAIF